MRWAAAAVLGLFLCGCGHPVTIALALWLTNKSSKAKKSVPTPRVVTDTLPDGVQGESYEAVLTAESGTPPYTWAAAGLPSGLVCNSSTGYISGTPTESGTFDITVTVTDSKGRQDQKTLSLLIKVVMITTEVLPDGAVNVAYSVQLEAVGGTTPYQWSVVDGSLPQGFTLETDGTLHGTADQTGDYTFTVEVQENGGATDQKTFTLHIGNIAVTTTSLPDGTVGESYGPAQLEAVGGTGSYTWSWSGNTPPGLDLSPDGQITGSPTQEGDFTFTVTATEQGGTETASKKLAIKVWEDLVISTQDQLPDAYVGEDYDFTLTATGGSGQFQWSWSGATPPLTLEANGRIYGTPSVGDEGTYTFTVQVDDIVNGDTASKQVTLKILRFQVTTTTLPDGFERFTYSAQLEAENGTPPYSWQRVGGSLPSGVSLESDGTISGTPEVGTGGDTYTFDVEVTDAEGRRATATLSITVFTTRFLEHFHNPGGIADRQNTAAFASLLRLSPEQAHNDPRIVSTWPNIYGETLEGNRWLAQTFTTSGGRLFKLDIRIRNVDYTSNPQPIYAEIYTLDANGMPDKLVASSVCIIDFVPWPSAWRSFSFSKDLSAGDYVVVLHSPATFKLRAGDNDPYTNGALLISTDGGSTWQQQSINDLDLRVTFVDSYYTSGYAVLWEVIPQMPSDWEWEKVRWGADIPQDTSVKIQVLYYDSNIGDWVPVPDTDLNGNSSGFDASAQTEIDLSGLDTSTYPELRVRLDLSTNDTTKTPSVDWVELTWAPK